MSQFQVWCDLENFLLEHDAAINNNHPQAQTGCLASVGPQDGTIEGPVGGPEGPKAYLGKLTVGTPTFFSRFHYS